MFESHAILNYMNDLVMNIVDMYFEMIEGNKFDEDSLMFVQPYVAKKLDEFNITHM